MDCKAAWYNVTKAFIRDTQRFRDYYATQDTELCLGLECPKCAERATEGPQYSGAHPMIQPCPQPGTDSCYSLWVGPDQCCASLADYCGKRCRLAKGPNPLGWPDRHLAMGGFS